MSTNIKFRGKRLDNGEWVYGYLIKDLNKHVIIPSVTCVSKEDLSFANRYLECFGYEVDKLTVGQYTGLKDKKIRKDSSEQKEIYKGDIVKALNRNYDCEENKEDYFQLFEVIYLNGCYMFGNWNAHEFFNKFIYIEVVGNIYDMGENMI